MDFVYKFPVVRGIQAGREYYIAMIPLKMLERLFPREDEYVLPEYRAQRKLNESRIPIISHYITENRDSYVFSALAASIDGEFKYISKAILLTANQIKREIGIPLLLDEEQKEKRYLESLSV